MEAVAILGTAMEGRIEVLKSFRDEVLLTSRAGTVVVKTYYRYSPPVAKWIADRAWLKAVVRAFLLPLTGLASLFI